MSRGTNLLPHKIFRTAVISGGTNGNVRFDRPRRSRVGSDWLVSGQASGSSRRRGSWCGCWRGSWRYRGFRGSDGGPQCRPFGGNWSRFHAAGRTIKARRTSETFGRTRRRLIRFDGTRHGRRRATRTEMPGGTNAGNWIAGFRAGDAKVTRRTGAGGRRETRSAAERTGGTGNAGQRTFLGLKTPCGLSRSRGCRQ